MIPAILWTLLGAAIGALAVALCAARKAAEIERLTAGNKRLIGNVATLSVQLADSNRELARARQDLSVVTLERDRWRAEAEKPSDAFNPHWSDYSPGERER